MNTAINPKIVTQREFVDTFFKTGKNPDGNKMTTIIIGDEPGSSYNLYLLRKRNEYLMLSKQLQQKKLIEQQTSLQHKSADENSSSNSTPKLYIWRTTGDASVRSEHAQKEGETFDWNLGDTKPGDDYNCRCYAEFVDENGNSNGKYGHGDNDDLNEPPEASTNNEEDKGDEGEKDGKKPNSPQTPNDNKDGADEDSAKKWKEKWDNSNLGKNKFSPYGKERDLQHYDKPRIHKGDDIALPEGTPIPAVKDGEVVRSGWESDNNHKQGYGQRITIKNNDGTYSIYGHMKEDSLKYQVGDEVSKGQTIGMVGNTGGSTGYHLHYSEKDFSGNYIEPSEESRQYLFDFYND